MISEPPSTSDDQQVDADTLMLERRAVTRELRAQTSKATRKRILLSARSMVSGDIMDAFVGVADRAVACRALVALDQQLAVLLGESKPPTLSVSQSTVLKPGRSKLRRIVDIDAVVKSLGPPKA